MISTPPSIDSHQAPGASDRRHRGTGRARLSGLAVLALAAVALAACGSDPADTDAGGAGTGRSAPTAAELDGRTFVSTSVEGHDLVDGSEIRLAFEADRLTVNAGCNTIMSAVELDGDRLAWSGIPGSTMMACDDDLMTQDEWLTELFTEGVTASLDDTTLTLTTDDVTIELEA